MWTSSYPEVESERVMADRQGSKYEQDGHLCLFCFFVVVCFCIWVQNEISLVLLLLLRLLAHITEIGCTYACNPYLTSLACAQCIKHLCVTSIYHQLQQRMEKFHILLPLWWLWWFIRYIRRTESKVWLIVSLFLACWKIRRDNLAPVNTALF